MVETETNEEVAYHELTENMEDNSGGDICSELEGVSLTEVNLNQLQTDFAEFQQRLGILFDPSNRIDVRAQLLVGFCKMISDVRLEEEFDFADVASAMTCGAAVCCKQGVLVSLDFLNEAHEVELHLKLKKQGRRFFQRIRLVYDMLFREDPKLVRELGWQIEEQSGTHQSCANDDRNAFTSPGGDHESHEDSFDPSVVSTDEVPDGVNDDSEPVIEESEGSRPHATQQAAMILRGHDSKEAGRLLVRLTHPTASRAIIKDQPEMVLSLLQAGDDHLGVTPSEAAAIADVLVGEFPDDQAASLVTNYLSSARITELVTRSGERSLLAHVITPQTLLRAVATGVQEKLELSNEMEAYEAFLTLVFDFRNREDWNDLLRYTVGHYRFEDYVLVAILLTQVPEIAASFEGAQITDDEPDDHDDDGRSDESRGISFSSEADADDEEEGSEEDFDRDEPEVVRTEFARQLATLQLSRSTVIRISASTYEEYGLDSNTAADRLLGLFPSEHAGDLSMSGFVANASEIELPKSSEGSDTQATAPADSEELTRAADHAAESLF